MIDRRRFLTIAGSALALGVSSTAFAALPAGMPLRRWQGRALGASASITLAHPRANALVPLLWSEVERLETIFSLYRRDSDLSQLNSEGAISSPPSELLELLSISETVHLRTNGKFDPSVQPLWRLFGASRSSGVRPSEDEVARARSLIGWQDVSYNSRRIGLRPGGALTFNGIAQGYIADRVASIMRNEGIDDVLIDTGEIRALGNRPDGTPWRVGVTGLQGEAKPARRLELSDRAVATSATMGTRLGPAGEIGHILDPNGGDNGCFPRQVSVIAGSAALADGLSTAFCLMDGQGIRNASSGVEVIVG